MVLAAFVQGNTAILSRAAAITEVAKSAPHEPEAAAVVEHSERLRREGLGQVFKLLADRFGLRSGATDEDSRGIRPVDLTVGILTPGPA